MVAWRHGILSVALCLGCDSAAQRGSDDDVPEAGRPLSRAVATVIGAAARPVLCEHEQRSDVVRDLFCSADPPQIASLAALEAALGVPTPIGVRSESSGAVMLAHSTALSGELVSELNPRAILISKGISIAFSRGLQQVEIAAAERGREGHFNFYLLEFTQACNHEAEGCGPAQLYAAGVEADWQSLTVRDDEDLKNTASDCRQCHQRGTDKAILLMREYHSPWTHFFGPDADEPKSYPEPTGSALLRDFLRLQGDQPYANIAPGTLKVLSGLVLQLLVDPAQPLRYEGSKITGERWPWREGGYPAQPERSATWDAAFAAWQRGEQLALPFYAPRVTDPAKQAALIEQYRSTGELPDLADIFPDDPQLRAEIGLQTTPDATAAQTLIQACGGCHNDVLDQNISRARFNIALARMDRAELDVAVARLLAAPDDPGVMPPRGRRQIPRDKLRELIEYLQRGARSADDVALLEHAAASGMAGGAPRVYPTQYPDFP
jgi:hypothetical protein